MSDRIASWAIIAVAVVNGVFSLIGLLLAGWIAFMIASILFYNIVPIAFVAGAVWLGYVVYKWNHAKRAVKARFAMLTNGSKVS